MYHNVKPLFLSCIKPENPGFIEFNRPKFVGGESHPNTVEDQCSLGESQHNPKR